MFCHMFRRLKNKENCNVSDQFLKVTEKSNSRSGNWLSQSILVSRDFHYVLSLIEKCLKHIMNSDVVFKTNPPYLPGILRNFNIKIIEIFKCYENNLVELSKINFFRISIWTLIKQSKEILRILRHLKSDYSESKQKLIKISILLSHLFHAVVALFPNSFYSPETFRITKSDAADWWNSKFGPLTTVVEWNDFFHFFSKLNYISEVSQIAELRKTINVTGNGFVSIFDFDVFVRLFQPWNNILESWKVIVSEHPGCMSYITYEQVVQLLKSFRYYPGPGSYVFRFSCTKPGQWAIGYIDFNGKIYQTIVHNKSLAIALFEGERAGIYKYPNGKIYDSSSLNNLIGCSHQNIRVSLEEHEAYCRIDSSFEICKICAQNNKNIKLEPCGHLLCSFCLNKWQKSFRCQSCPFCRLEIKGIEKISLIPYNNSTNNTNNGSKTTFECPLVLSSLTTENPVQHHDDQTSIGAVVATKENTGQINYAQLEWMSINDSGYCVNSHFDDDNVDSVNKLDTVPLVQSSVSCSPSENPSNITTSQAANQYNMETSVNYGLLPYPHYLNLCSSTTAAVSNNGNNNNSSSTTNSSSNQIMHIKKNSEAMKKLLKITGNVTMSKEILKYFTPRSICSNS